jgi:hypothetical protein
MCRALWAAPSCSSCRCADGQRSAYRRSGGTGLVWTIQLHFAVIRLSRPGFHRPQPEQQQRHGHRHAGATSRPGYHQDRRRGHGHPGRFGHLHHHRQQCRAVQCPGRDGGGYVSGFAHRHLDLRGRRRRHLRRVGQRQHQRHGESACGRVGDLHGERHGRPRGHRHAEQHRVGRTAARGDRPRPWATTAPPTSTPSPWRRQPQSWPCPTGRCGCSPPWCCWPRCTVAAGWADTGPAWAGLAITIGPRPKERCSGLPCHGWHTAIRQAWAAPHRHRQRRSPEPLVPRR